MTASDLLAGLERISPAVATWLLTYAVHSTLLLGIVWLVCKRAGLRSNALKEMLWKAAIIGGIVTATISVATGGASFLGRIEVPGPGSLSVAGALSASPPAGPTVNDNQVSGGTGGIAGATGMGNSLAPGQSTVGQNDGPPSASANPAQNPRPAQGTQPAADFLQSAGNVLLSRWSDLLVAVWLLCTAVAAVRAVSGRRRLAGYLGKRHAVSDGLLVEELAGLCRSAGIKLPLRITCSSMLTGPVSLGRAEICLPERVATDLSREQQRCILAHELAHLVRRDPTWLTVLAFIEAPLFFQPLNRLARRRMQELAEYLCDDWAVRQTGSAISLARCLVEVANWMQRSRHHVPVAGMVAGASPLVQRVARLVDGQLLGREESVSVRRGWIVAAILFPLAVGWMAPTVSIRPSGAASQSQPTASPADQSGASTRFIDVKSEGDVVFTANREDVQSISPGGLFMIEQFDGIANRRVAISALDDGTLSRWYYVNTRPQQYDAAAQAWLAQALSQLVLATGSGSSPFPDLSGLPALPDVNKPAHAAYAASVMDLQAPAATGHIEARAQGGVSFTDDLTGIKGISFGGSFVVEEKQGAITRKLQAMPTAGGKAVLSYLINGQPQSSEAAQSWLAKILPDLVPALNCHINPLALPTQKGQ